MPGFEDAKVPQTGPGRPRKIRPEAGSKTQAFRACSMRTTIVPGAWWARRTQARSTPIRVLHRSLRRLGVRRVEPVDELPGWRRGG